MSVIWYITNTYFVSLVHELDLLLLFLFDTFLSGVVAGIPASAACTYIFDQFNESPQRGHQIEGYTQHVALLDVL